MEKEKVLAYLDEAGKAEIMELLDAVINRFHELYPEWELIVSSLPAADPQARRHQAERIGELLRKYEGAMEG